MINQNYLKYFTAIAIGGSLAVGIAFSLQPSSEAQTKINSSSDNIRQRLASEWENAVITRSLESATQINAIEFSPDGQLLASVGASQITLWNINSGEIQRVLPGHYASDIKLEIAPTEIAFSADSQYLATSTLSQGLLTPDRAVTVRDVATGEVVLEIADADGCRQIAFDVSGEFVYGACGFGVTAWNFPAGKKLFSFDTKYPVDAIALNPDSTVMATVDANVSGGQQGEKSNEIQLWKLNASKPELLKTLDGHANDIARLEFTADGKRLVSSSYDGKINVWNWQQGTTHRQTNNLYSNDGVFSLSPNSQLIAGNFHSSILTNLRTGLPLTNAIKLPRRQETAILAFSPQAKLFARVQNKIDANSSIDLWSAEDSTPADAANAEGSYKSTAIAKYWTNQAQPNISQASQPQITKPVSIGTDVKAIALSGLGLTEAAESEVRVEYPSDNLATVTLVRNNLRDDSVAAIRYLLKFAPYGNAADKKWQVVWVGEQFKCQSGRGHQDWSADLCQ